MMKNNKKLLGTVFNLFLPILVVAACSLLLFTKMDSKINDLFMRALPPLEENREVLLVNIDDNLIDETGVWPLTRNIYADMLITMRELGAEAFISDLSFVDNSPMQVDQEYLNDDLPRYVDQDFEEIDESVGNAITSLTDGNTDPAMADDLYFQLIDENEGIKNRLKTSILSATKNYDIALANALKFFGNSYLTLWMQVGYDMRGVDMVYLNDYLALNNVVSDGDTKTPEFYSVQPAIDVLIKNSASTGFVNADPDSDGYLRRLNLVTKFRGRYYGQLVFVPILHHYGDPQVIVSDSSITLKDAKISDTETRDIVIPRGEDGKVIVKFPKKKFHDYNQISAWNIYRISFMEKKLVKNLKNMSDQGYFMNWEGDETPIDIYDSVEFIREELYKGESEDYTFETYMEYLNSFYDVTEEFLNGGYQEGLIEVADGNEFLTDEINAYFQACRSFMTDLRKSREET
ncbi:MAG: CHASE2 domain-containing protein, partial [Treponema sp.]|nr:CHASE2 domain-containing protein [Treponema sp.]